MALILKNMMRKVGLGIIPVGGAAEPYGGRAKATLAIIIANIIVYVLTSYSSYFISTSSYWVEKLAMVPLLLLEPSEWYRLLTSMFLHADIIHILFNMYFLYIFGREVERSLGIGRYLLLYFSSGLAATLFHIGFTPIMGFENLIVPALGASGAISGVLGAYLLLYPNRRLTICWFFWLIPWCFTTTASFYLIFWFALQVIYGYARLGSIAFFAHAGGFVAGLALMGVFKKKPFEEIAKPPETMPYHPYYEYYEGYLIAKRYAEATLGSTARTILLILLTILVIGEAYSFIAATEASAPIYIYSIEAGHSISSMVEDVAVYQVGRGVIFSPVNSDPRIVLNRLYWAGLLNDESDKVYTSYTYSKTIVSPIGGVPVNIQLKAYMKYDGNGVLVESHGEIVTDVLQITGSRVFIVRNQYFVYNISAGEPVTNIGQRLIMPSLFLPIVFTVTAIIIIYRKKQPRYKPISISYRYDYEYM